MSDSERDRIEQQKLSAEILLQDAREAMGMEDLEGALELLRMSADLDPDRMEVETYVDMVRSQLVKRYRNRVGDPRSVVRLAVAADEVSRFNLSSVAGFLLSQVDGSTTVEQLLTLSGVDSFESYRALSGLLDAGIVAVES